MSKLNFKPGTMLNPVPAVMVSCGTEEEHNIITVAWTGIVNSEPPMTYVSVRKQRHSHDMIAKTGEFVINMTTEKLAFATDYCGVRSGRDVDKFKEQNLTPVKGEKVNCPVIKESPVNLECKVVEVHEYGSHDMFVAEIVNVQVDEELMDERGRIRLDQAGLLAYNHGEYFGLKKTPIGKFGYSVMKPKTKKRIAGEKRQQARNKSNRRKKKG
jgi:flavin reductase (DIM6/NTAB) family NADH-FMN oxidoreductase RutF